MKSLLVISLLATACSVDSWNPPLQPTIANGYHKCSSGALCPEFTACSYDMKCVFIGDTNGPGGADTALDTSVRVSPPR